MVYFLNMQTAETAKSSPVNLTKFREDAGLTVRALARELGINHTTILKWEQTGKVAKTEFLVPMSNILGVTIEELLGQPKPRNSAAPGGKLGQLFRDVSGLPRRKQERIVEVVEALVAQQMVKS